MVRITKEQQRALLSVYRRDVSVAPSYLEFRRRAFVMFGDCLMFSWKGMTVGIEADGYTHT